MDTVAMAALLATWTASSEGVSIALEALAVLRIIGDGQRPGDLLVLPLTAKPAIQGSTAIASIQPPPNNGPADNDLQHEGSVLAMLGGLEFAQGNLQRARSAEDEARSIFHSTGDRRWEGLSFWYLALIASAEHKQREAARAYCESLLAFIDAGDPPLVYKPLLGLASIAADVGQADIAAQLLGSAGEQRRRSGDHLLPFDLAAEQRADVLSRRALGEVAFLARQALGQNHDAMVWVQLASDIVAAANERDACVARAGAGNGDVLTVREQDVLRLMVEGRSNPEIADALCVGVGTAKTHVAHILAKLGVSTRAAAATHAVRQGLI